MSICWRFVWQADPGVVTGVVEVPSRHSDDLAHTSQAPMVEQSHRGNKEVIR